MAAYEPSAATLAGLLALLLASTFVEAFPVPIENVPVGAPRWPRSSSSAPRSSTAGRPRSSSGSSRRSSWRSAGASRPSASSTTRPSTASPPPRRARSARRCPTRLRLALGRSRPRLVGLLRRQPPLVAAVVSRWARDSFFSLLRRAVSSTFIAFAIMTSLTLMLAVLWERSPFLSAALVGPLAAIALYQRSVFRELAAMRLALTDPLTGLGNHRHFHERLDRDLTEAEDKGMPLSVCVLDIDNFKELNDRFGHPRGDQILAQVATRLRQDGEAFRIGGDEFAILLPGRDEREAAAEADGVLTRVAMLEAAPGLPRPHLRRRRHLPAGRSRPLGGLLGRGPGALHREGLREGQRAGVPPGPRGAARRRGPDRGARPRSPAQGRRRARARRGRAGRLHGPSLVVVESSPRASPSSWGRAGGGRAGAHRRQPARPRKARHPRGDPPQARPADRRGEARAQAPSADRLPDAPLARRRARSTWILHHHERWDGRGYPHGLRRADPPRLADHPRRRRLRRDDERPIYRSRVSHEVAIAELERNAGAQFDPRVVSVFVQSVAREEALALKNG